MTLLSDLILIKSFIGFWGLFKYFSVVINQDKSPFFLDFLFDVFDSLDWKFPNFVVAGLEKTVSVVLEGYFLRSYVNLVLVVWKPNEDGLLPGGSVQLAHIILVHEDDAPFGVFVQVSFHDFERFHNRVAFIFQFAHKLCHHFCVSFASEIYVTQVFVFNLTMVIDDSIVNDENFLILVGVWMAISLIYLTTSGPSCVGNSDCGVYCLLGELVDKSLNAI